jgi:hypothetical protein
MVNPTPTSFYTDGTVYDEAEVVTNDHPSSSVPSTAPTSFYPDGNLYDYLSQESAVLAELDALANQVRSDKLASDADASAAANSASNAATSAANAAAALQASAGTATPLIAGTAAVGTSTKWAHEDHVHPKDTTLASVSYVDTKVAAVVNSAPATLDTLNELATALGNDPNFATTTATQIGLKAPLASPALTGAPTAPTPTAGDNSTKIATTAYVTTALTPYRTALTANTTYYVRTDGSDSNTGLANTSGGAFLTLAKAMTVAGALDCLSYQLTISVQAGTFTAPVSLPRVVGALPPILTGVGSTTFISITGPSPAVQNIAGTPWIVQNMKLASTAGDGLHTELGGSIQFQGIEFGACGGNGHIVAYAQSTIKCLGNYSISGSSLSHFQCVGYIDCANFTVTFLANVSFGTAFAYAATPNGYLRGQSNTYSLGSFTVTGPRYFAQWNALLFTGSAGATYFPGSTAGSTLSGGIYS